MPSKALVLAVWGLVLVTWVTAEPEIGFTQSFSLTSAEGTWTPEAAVHLVVVPPLKFSEAFQADSRLDVVVTKTGTSSLLPVVTVQEAFLDFLSWNTLRVRGGYLKNEIGYNSHFHPLEVLGTTEARPGVGVGLTATSPEGGWKASWDNLEYFLSSRTLKDNLLVEKLTISVADGAVGIMAGVQSNPFGGAYASWVTPWGLNLFWEGIYKTSSLQPLVEAGKPVMERLNRGFFDQSLRGEYTGLDPWFQNTFSVGAEWYWNGEGLSTDEYDQLVFYSESLGSPTAATNLFSSNQNLQTYGHFNAGYASTLLGLGGQYEVTWESASGRISQSVGVSRSVDNAELTVFASLNTAPQPKYLIGFGDQKTNWGLTLSLEL